MIMIMSTRTLLLWHTDHAQVKVYLTLSPLGKTVSRRHIEIFVLFFPENRIQHFMQSVFGDNLHEMSNPVFWGK